MKKILCAVLALAAMASCTKEYTIDNPKQAIAFGEAFVNNGTRADYSDGTNEVDAFKVYGTLTGNSNTVQIFNGATVSRPDGLTGYDGSTAWNCTETQYWVPSASYKFAAIVDGQATATTGLPVTIPFTVTDGDGDLLYAETTATVNSEGTPDVSLVEFTFDHLLSKVQFTVKNMLATGYSIQVTGISVTDVAKNGVYTVSSGTWAKDGDVTTDAPLTFGATGVIASAGSAVASETRQILPVEQTLAVAIAYDIYYNDGSGNKKISSTAKTGTIPATTYAKNSVYNITAEIDATKIQFTVAGVNGFKTPVVEDDME